MKQSAVIVALVGVALMPQLAGAQSDYGGGWAVPSLDTSISITNEIVNREIATKIITDEARDRERSRFTSREARSLPPSATRVSPSSVALFRYVPSAVQRRKNLANFVAKTKARDPQSAAKMEQLFSSADVIAQIGQGLAPFGLDVNNIADAYAAYWMSSWQAAAGTSGTFDPQQVSKVKAQAQSLLIASPKAVNASNEEKQEFAEALLVQTALIEASMEQATGDRSQIRAIGNAVRKAARTMGLDLEIMTLTDDGFVLINRTGRLDDTDPKQNPAADEARDLLATKDSDSEHTDRNYALIAAAGGAGLGAMIMLSRALSKRG